MWNSTQFEIVTSSHIVLWILMKKPKGKENVGRISFTKGQQRQHPVFLRTSQVRGAQRLTCVPALYAEIFVNRGYPFQTLNTWLLGTKRTPHVTCPKNPGQVKNPYRKTMRNTMDQWAIIAPYTGPKFNPVHCYENRLVWYCWSDCIFNEKKLYSTWYRTRLKPSLLAETGKLIHPEGHKGDP